MLSSSSLLLSSLQLSDTKLYEPETRSMLCEALICGDAVRQRAVHDRHPVHMKGVKGLACRFKGLWFGVWGLVFRV